MERSLIRIVFIFFLLSLDLFSEKQAMKDQIDFSKEKPVHPFYDKFGQNGNLNCKEKK